MSRQRKQQAQKKQVKEEETPLRKEINALKLQLKKMKKPEDPKKSEFGEKIKKIHQEINQYFKEIDELHKKKHELTKQRQKIHREFQKHQKEFQKTKDEIKRKQQLVDKQKKEFENFKSVTNNKSSEHNKQKQTMNFRSQEEINYEVERLQEVLETTSLSGREERDLLARITQIKKLKHKIKEISNTDNNIQSQYEKLTEKRKQLQKSKSELHQLYKKRDKSREIVNKHWEIKEKKHKEIVALTPSFKEKFGKIDELKEQIQKFGKEDKKKYTELNKWRDEQYKLQKKIQEKEKEEEELIYKKEQEERKKEEALLVPWETEILICNKIIAFLNNLLPRDTPTTSKRKNKKNQSPQTTKIPKGFKKEEFLLAQKKDEVEEEFFALTKNNKKGKGKGKGKGRGRGQRKQPQKKKQKSDVLKIPFSWLTEFDSIMIEQPKSKSEIPELIKKVKLRKQYYKKLPRDAKPTASNVIPKTVQKGKKKNNDKKTTKQLIKLNLTIKEDGLVKVQLNLNAPNQNKGKKQNQRQNNKNNNRNNRRNNQNKGSKSQNKKQVQKQNIKKQKAPVVNNEKEFPSLSNKAPQNKNKNKKTRKIVDYKQM
ncbi:nuclear segregation protein bfr1 [Anaeramoeba flamelloides]|uniref:Nuclear segregation protein bfr1 n=1 Tax=Anaeramoeba flamelloides TaxID=1746091 RepID=A0AAV8AGY7_9EUKA|nr:nuclear segregation protein bfr1 [Anaeramoeba flamelloides]